MMPEDEEDLVKMIRDHSQESESELPRDLLILL